jgi:hypothetical protein
MTRDNSFIARATSFSIGKTRAIVIVVAVRRISSRLGALAIAATAIATTATSAVSSCTFSLADPITLPNELPVVLAAAQPEPWAIVLDDVSVYWTNDNAQDLIQGSVGKVPKDKSRTPSTLARSQDDPGQIAVDDQYVYWTNRAGGTVMRQLKSGGSEPEIIAANQSQPVGLVVDETNIYWTDVDRGRVLKQVKADTSGAVATLASGLPGPWLMTQDTTTLYFTTLDGQVVQRLNKDGMTPAQTVAPCLGQGWGIVVDDAAVYWRDEGSDKQGRVMKVPKAGGATPKQLATTTGEGPRFMAIDQTNLYWTSGNNDSGLIVTSAKDGSGAITLAVNQAGPRGVAVDDTSIYWTNYSGATVMKLTKPHN